jgi:hypothetical protein
MTAASNKQPESEMMAISIHWGNEKHSYLVVKYEIPWSWDEYDAATDKVVGMLRDEGRQLEVILDASASPYPPSPAAMQHFQRAWERLSPLMSYVIVVGAGGFFRQVGNTFSRLFIGKDMLRFVDTSEEAQRIVEERHK